MVKMVHLSKTGSADHMVQVPAGRPGGQKEVTTFCCVKCRALFERPAHRPDVKACKRCDPESHEGIWRTERGGGKGRARLRPPEREMGLGDKAGMKQEEIKVLEARLNRALEAGDEARAAQLRELLAWKRGKGPRPKPARQKGG